MKAGKMPLFDWAAKSDGRHDASSEAAEDLLGTKLRAAAGSNVGCANLRDLVRDLAVRGRLVPQEPGDRSAENVLAQMAKERSAILKKRGTNAKKPAEDDGATEEAFVVRGGWVWASLEELSAAEPNAVTDGPFGQNLMTEHYVSSPGYRVVRLGNIGIGEFVREKEAYVTRERYESLAKHRVFPGDLLIAGLAEPVGRACLVPDDLGPALVKADCFRFKPHPQMSARYLMHFLNSPFGRTSAEAAHHGITRTRINLGNLKSLRVPVPPPEEQKRIVAKVDQLMALCDELEAKQTRKRDVGDRLTKAALGALTSAKGAEFQLAWKRVLTGFGVHTESSQRVGLLRDSIRCLMLSGRAGRIEAPSNDVPEGWTRTTIGRLAELITSGSRNWKNYYAPTGAIFIRSHDIREDVLDLEEPAYVAPPQASEGTRTRVALGDVLITITGSNVGRCARVHADPGEAYVSQHVALVRLRDPGLSEWLHTWLVCSNGRAQLLSSSYGDKPGLNLNNIRAVVVDVPPHEEQRPILSRLAQLMKLCDDLESKLRARDEKAAKLAAALVAEAIA